MELAIDRSSPEETEKELVHSLVALAGYAMIHLVKDIVWVKTLCNPPRSRKRVNGLYAERKSGNFIYLDYSLDQDMATKVLIHECIHVFVCLNNGKKGIMIEEEFAYSAEDFLWERLNPDEKAFFRSYLPSRLRYLKKLR